VLKGKPALKVRQVQLVHKAQPDRKVLKANKVRAA
jgi:hypothetical protein